MRTSDNAAMTVFDPSEFSAVLFDLDGVLTPTAEVHMRAWRSMFSDYLREAGVSEPYTDEDYFAYIDGKPRYDGVRSLLASRGLSLPDGEPEDSPETLSVCGLGNRKNDLVHRLLEAEGVTPYAGSVAFLNSLGQETPVAVVSSSKNAPEVLSAAGLRDRFTVIVDGRVAAERGLPGKPAPDTFVYAAELLGADPARAVVVEDAVSGVRAGAAGPFALVIGVDRGVGGETLREAGADLVVSDLGELVPAASTEGTEEDAR
ncbi:HAD family hydrolase [Dermabacteraceae bacterium P7074]